MICLYKLCLYCSANPSISMERIWKKKKKEKRVTSHSVKELIWTYRPGVSVGTESACSAGGPSSIPGSRRSPGEEIGLPHQYSRASLVSQLVKNLPAMWETWVWPLGWEDSLERECLPTPVFCLENSMDCVIHGVAKSWTRLSEFHSLTQPELSVTWSHEDSVF